LSDSINSARGIARIGVSILKIDSKDIHERGGERVG